MLLLIVLSVLAHEGSRHDDASSSRNILGFRHLCIHVYNLVNYCTL
jgi:hypothetical protein